MPVGFNQSANSKKTGKKDKEKLTGNSTDLLHILHHVLSGRLQVGQEGDSIRDRLNVVDRQGDSDGMGDSDQVKHSVRRSSQSHRQDLLPRG